MAMTREEARKRLANPYQPVIRTPEEDKIIQEFLDNLSKKLKKEEEKDQG